MSRPIVTTICGSTRYAEAQQLAQMHLSMMGRIVIPCGLYGHADHPQGAKHLTSDGDETKPEKQGLDELHYRKIDLSDGIFVVNVAGHVGSSTRREIEYAFTHAKNVEWMFPDAIPEEFR